MLLSLVAAPSSFGREPAEEFVKGLEDRGMHELALEYLELLKTSPVADDAIRQQIPYLRGTALIEQSRQSADAGARGRLLDQARQELEKFAETNPHSVQGAEAQLQLATVQMSRGQELVAQLAQLPNDATYGAQRRKLGQDARVLFADAHDTFARAEGIYSSELEKLPPAAEREGHNEAGSKRQEYRARVAQLRFLAAQTQFESAQSYPPDAEEFRKINEAAAQDLSAIYDEFARTLLVGLYARLYEGRCYAAISKYQEALGCYDEIIGKDNVLPAFRKLIASAVRYKAETLIAQQKFDAAIDACKDELKTTRREEERQHEWLGLRFRYADALVKKAATSGTDSAEHRRLSSEARDVYRSVAKWPGEFQLAARTAAASSGGAKTADQKKEEPKTFQAAYDMGKEALSNFNAAKLAIPTAERNNPTALPELKAQMESGKEDARRYFRLATTLVEDDTDLKVLNEVRYFLCWLYWENRDYYRAAVLGEFIARRYPDHPAASSSAKIAMASLEQLYTAARTAKGNKDAGQFEAGQMSKLAEFISRRWPGTEDADAAFGVLLNDAIRSGRIEDGEKLLSQATQQSRPRLELQLGNAMWVHYLGVSQGSEKMSDTDKASLEKLKSTAVKYLTSGFNALRMESPVSEPVAMAALYMAQALASDGKYSEAIEALEDKKAGALALVAGDNPTASKPAYAIEAYKAALRAYVSVSPPDEKKALSTMQLLERAVQENGDTAKAAEQLNRIYIGLGVGLRKHMEELGEANDDEGAKRVAKSLAKLVERVGKQQGPTNWPLQMWLAQTNYAIAVRELPSAKKDDGTPTALSPTSKIYFTRARDSYQQLIKESVANPKLLPNKPSLLAAKMQLAECCRALGQYQESLDMFSEVLFEREASLDVQRAAALTFQERGQKEDPKWLAQAILGGYKLKTTGKNRIWGWQKISELAQGPGRKDKTFRDAFFEARLNIARCRYLTAMKMNGDERRQELKRAEHDIQSIAILYPDLGGDKWKTQFDELLKSIKHEAAKAQGAPMKDE
jgi:hypothetical protein